MKCGAYSLVGLDGQDAGVFPMRCKRWSCAACGPRKARGTIVRVRRGMALGPTRFFTLTSPGREDPAMTYVEFPQRWKRFHQRVERRFGRIEYIGVVEPQKRGAAHIHVVYRGPFIPQQWLSRAAREAGFGRIADIRRSNPRLMSYLAKYLAKGLATGAGGSEPGANMPKYFRRVRVSKGWCDWNAGRTKPRWQKWWIANAVPEHAAIDAARKGYHVVEVHSDRPGATYHPSRLVRWLRDLGPFRPLWLPTGLTAAPRSQGRLGGGLGAD